MKNKVAILVDSGTDVPQELIEKYQMYVIPLKIIYKDRVYYSGRNLSKITSRDSRNIFT